MNQYTAAAYELAATLTKRYSTSFSMSSRLFDRHTRRAIYAIYGMVRLADEIVDSYDGNDARGRLDAFEAEVGRALASGYSTNPIIHAFADTARAARIGKALTKPFFASMRTDLTVVRHTERSYRQYVYGSAEVVGLMCLKVFVRGDRGLFDELKPGAQALGAAYQKINFLRDIAADYTERGRSYFPGVNPDQLSERDRRAIVKDIEMDLALARPAVKRLPAHVRPAVATSLEYYQLLFDRLKSAPIVTLRTRRLRVPNWQKGVLFLKARAGR